MFSGPPQNSAGLFNKQTPTPYSMNTTVSSFNFGNQGQTNNRTTSLFDGNNNNNMNSQGTMVGGSQFKGGFFGSNNNSNLGNR